MLGLGKQDLLDAPMTARVAHELFSRIFMRFDAMSVDLSQLKDAVAKLRTETTAARSRDAAAHQAAVSDMQAEINAMAADVMAAASAVAGLDAPAAPAITAAVPFPASSEGDTATLLRAALPGNSQPTAEQHA